MFYSFFMRLFFRWRYFRGETPWDTNITPPELVQLIEHEQFPPGRALDLGCGTGTNSIYLARHGFQVIGIDFVARAIDAARNKANAQKVAVEFRVGDVLSPGALTLPVDLILDIGCFHTIDPQSHPRYAQNASAWTRPGSVLLIYAFFPRELAGRPMGKSRAEMEALFGDAFTLERYADDARSAWYRWRRK